MKILFLLLFFPLLVAAQSGEPLSDTTYLVKQDGAFFEMRRVTYPSGNEMTTKTLIGDTAALVTATMDRAATKAAKLAVDVRYTSTAGSQIDELVLEADAVRRLTGIDPLRRMQDDLAEPLLATGWKLDGKDVSFSLNASGTLCYTVAGMGARPALVLGDVIRLKRWSGGKDADLFRLPNGGYTNQAGDMVLTPAAGTVKRTR